MAANDLGEDVCHIGLRIDAIELAGLDERNDYPPVFGAAVGASEVSVLPIK